MIYHLNDIICELKIITDYFHWGGLHPRNHVTALILRVTGNFWIAMRKYRIRSTTKSALGKDRYEHLYNRLPSLAAPVCLVSLIHWTNYRFALVNIFFAPVNIFSQ